MYNFNVIKTTLIELPFIQADQGLQRYFPVQNFLRKKKIVSIESYTNLDFPLSYITPTNGLPTGAQLQSGALTLYGDNPEPNDDGSISPAVWLDTIPLITLHRTNNGTDPFVYDLYTMVPRILVWEKSYIRLTTQLNNADNATSFCLLVGYLGNEGDN